MKRVRDMDESDSSHEEERKLHSKKSVSFDESSNTNSRSRTSAGPSRTTQNDPHCHDGDNCTHHGGHSHGPKSSKPNGLPDDYKPSVQFKEIAFPKSLDVVAIGYPLFVLALAYGALFFKDHIVNEEAYDKFHERIQWMRGQTTITTQLLISEIFKHFPVLAFTTLSMFYLIKPIKGATSTVRLRGNHRKKRSSRNTTTSSRNSSLRSSR